MAAPTLRHIADLVGAKPPLSLCRDVLDFTEATVPARLNASRDRPAVSLRSHHDLVHHPFIDLVLIYAGSDLMSTADLRAVDHAVWRTRDIYAAVGIAVRRVDRVFVSVAESGGHDTVATEDEIAAAGHDLSVDGPVVPVVIPADMNVSVTDAAGNVTVTAGLSPMPGPCGHRDEDEMNSAVVMLNGEKTARTLAHEVGHYLGCDHRNSDPKSLMCQALFVTGDPFTAVAIPSADANTMTGHCTIRPAVAADTEVYRPADFTVDELQAAARGSQHQIAASLAVTLLRAKLGDRAEAVLVRLAADPGIDVRARRTAVLNLGDFPTAAPALRQLTTSGPDLVARAAQQTLTILERRLS